MGNEDEEIERIKKKKLQEMMDDTHQRERRMMDIKRISVIVGLRISNLK